MPLIDITNPKVINFFVENYEKERRLRANWNEKHQEKIQQAVVLNRESKNYYESDVMAFTMAEGMACTTRDQVVAGYNRRKVPIRDGVFIPGVKNLRHGHSLVDIGLGDPQKDPRFTRPDDDLTPDPIMRPVDPDLINKVLFEPKPHYGREKYLEKRAKMWPEKKYYFPECSNWDYGWRMKDSGIINRPTYGRRCLLQRALKNRVGFSPDPVYYKSPDELTVVKC